MRQRSALHCGPMWLGKHFTFLVEECIRADSHISCGWIQCCLLLGLLYVVRFPPSAVNEVATAPVTSVISPVLVTATSRAYGRHSSESDVDTPPKVDATPLFEASPKGFLQTCSFYWFFFLFTTQCFVLPCCRDIYRVTQIKWHHFTFLLVTNECKNKILWF